MTTKQVIAKLVNDICKVEGKEHNASKGDVAEIVGIVSDAFHNSNGSDLFMAMIENGALRAAARAKRKAQSKAFLAGKKKKK